MEIGPSEETRMIAAEAQETTAHPSPPPVEDTRVDTQPAPPSRRCARCGADLESGQYLEYRGAQVCMPCVGKALDGWPRPEGVGRPNPVVAVLLSLFPGLGQMYNRQLFKGALIMGGFLFVAIADPFRGSDLQGVVLAVVYFVNLFDAWFTARRLQRGEVVEDLEPLWARRPVAGEPEGTGAGPRPRRRELGSPGWGLLLIVLGVLFLLNNFDWQWLTLEYTWPVAVLGFGLWLIFSSAFAARRPEGDGKEGNDASTD